MPLRARFDTQLYGYVVTEYVAIIFVVVFALSTFVHTGQAIRYRLPWLLFTIVPGGILEILGWAGRLWNAVDPRTLDAYLMQICCLILAPAFIMASNYLLLALVINKLGHEYSRIPPKWYTIVFCTADVISLVVQAIGGGSAAIAVQSVPPRDPNKGAKIMVGGIIFQMAVMVCYTALGTEFLLRARFKRPIRSRAHSPSKTSPSSSAIGEHEGHVMSRDEDKKLNLVVLGLALSTLFIFIRSVYRTIELLDGWTGPIIANQQLFNLLDGMMIILSLLSVNFLHPGYLLDTRHRAVSLGMKKRRNDVDSVALNESH